MLNERFSFVSHYNYCTIRFQQTQIVTMKLIKRSNTRDYISHIQQLQDNLAKVLMNGWSSFYESFIFFSNIGVYCGAYRQGELNKSLLLCVRYVVDGKYCQDFFGGIFDRTDKSILYLSSTYLRGLELHITSYIFYSKIQGFF